MTFILKRKLNYYTRKSVKFFTLMMIPLVIILLLLIAKFKISYKVTIDNQMIGYVENKQTFSNMLSAQILEPTEKNAEFVTLNEEPKYEAKLLSRKESTNEDEVISTLKDKTTTTYKIYEVDTDDNTKVLVDTIEQAKTVVDNIKKEYPENEDLDLKIIERYTNNIEEVKVDSVEVAENNLKNKIKEIEEKNKVAEEKVPNINGIKLSQTPVEGILTSRYGEGSRRRKSSHTGLDIACKSGTNIKAVANGKVTFAEYKGSYGNLLKIDHGNGVETWYAHCSKLYAKVGKNVKAGDVIATVGSTGNSTGPHLHLEIRVDGNTLNPQNYLYK